jgi:uncharacterized protein (DUF1697 family)
MGRFIALARGLNVGGKNRLKMARLVALFEDEGALSVRTYVQSGNVGFSLPGRGSEAGAQALADRVTSALQKSEGIGVPFVVRPQALFQAAIDQHPFAQEESDERFVSIGFLAKKAGMKEIAQLDPEKSPGDRFQIQGTLVYLHTPSGMGKSKLTSDFFDRGLSNLITVRNLRTVKALAEL